MVLDIGVVVLNWHHTGLILVQSFHELQVNANAMDILRPITATDGTGPIAVRIQRGWETRCTDLYFSQGVRSLIHNELSRIEESREKYAAALANQPRTVELRMYQVYSPSFSFFSCWHIDYFSCLACFLLYALFTPFATKKTSIICSKEFKQSQNFGKAIVLSSMEKKNAAETSRMTPTRAVDRSIQRYNFQTLVYQ